MEGTIPHINLDNDLQIKWNRNISTQRNFPGTKNALFARKRNEKLIKLQQRRSRKHFGRNKLIQLGNASIAKFSTREKDDLGLRREGQSRHPSRPANFWPCHHVVNPPVDVEKTSSSMSVTTTTNVQSKKKRKFSEVDYEPLLTMSRTMRFVVGQKVEVRGIGAHYNKTWFRAEVTAIYGGTLHCPVSYDFVYEKTSEGNWKHETEKKVTHNSDKMRPWRGHAHTLRSQTVDENKNDLCEETPGMSLSAFFNYS